ncbi:MAG TPA: hypothetical protein VHK67_06200 [Rhabdochlamydiaceae bacterium]|nr:hypothetical protein [Rhabdochlamydiaceae bacterium]
MRIVGIALLALTILLGILKFDHLSIWSAGVGVALAAGLFLALITNKPEEIQVSPLGQENNPWQVRFLDLQAQTNLTIETLNAESKKMQQKLARAEERCTSYQKLVDVHQAEIDQLRRQAAQMGQQIIEKDRKVTELQLAKLEPDLFDTEKRKTESSYRELKKQFEEKSQALELARSRLYQAESHLLSIQKEKENPNPAELALIQQLKQMEEDKKQLESELASLQQVVSELSLTKGKRKKTQLTQQQETSL